MWTPGGTEEKMSAAERLHGFLDDEYSAQKNRGPSKIIGMRHEKDIFFSDDFAGIFYEDRR
jgi:hypothetical protein